MLLLFCAVYLLLLSGRADQLYDVLSDKEKATFNDAIEALEKQLLLER